MISLNPEFVGSLAPEPKLTTAVNEKHDIPFARLPRLERLRVQGKADETEEQDEGLESADDAKGGQVGREKPTKVEKEKKKMRGKNKSLKRYSITISFSHLPNITHLCRQVPSQTTEECHRSQSCELPPSPVPPSAESVGVRK